MFFWANNIVKNSDKEKYVYCGYGVAFNWKVEWSFDSDYTGNVIMFGVDNSSSCHFDNNKNNILILGEGETFGINGSLQWTRKTVL